MADDNTLKPLAWRFKHPSHPGMIGHYPWSYVEQEPRRAHAPDDLQALCSLAAAKARIAELERERDQARSERDTEATFRGKLAARVAEMERQPLTDAERISLYTQAPNFSHGRALFMAGIKAAERAHRIGTTDATGDAA